MQFEKWHGIGNDFLVVHEDDLVAAGALEPDVTWARHDAERRPQLTPDAARMLCHRNFGVGGDGVLVLGASAVDDARMVIHNADGSTARMCGNGIRIAARWLAEREHVAPGPDGVFAIETAGGTMRPVVLAGTMVRVDMGELTTEGIERINLADTGIAGVTASLEGRVVSVGNPHFVVLRAPDGPDLLTLGPAAERHPRFADRTNVEFYEQVGRSEVRMRVWERGVGETLACGTGACAVALTAVLDDGLEAPVRVQLPGGSLDVDIVDGRAFMTGPAVRTWRGEVDPAALVTMARELLRV